MTPRRVGGIAVAMLAVGVLTGAAGSIVVREATAPAADLAAIMTDHMNDAGLASMMSGAMMGSGSMMGPGSSMGPGMMTGPAASSMPGGLHDQHHPAATPSAAP